MSSQSITKSLAILPFRPHHEKESSDVVILGEGIADSLATRLYDLEGLEVRPPSSVRKHLGQKIDNSFELGKLLSVDYILEGYIFNAKQRTRFTVQLLNIPDRKVLWAAQFDETETDVFQLEDRITERIVQAIVPLLENKYVEPVTGAIPSPETGEVEAAELLAGLEAESQTPEEEPPPPPPPSEAIEEKRAERKSAPIYYYPLAALLVAALVFAGGYFLWRDAMTTGKSTASKNLPDVADPSILVLPFQNVGENPAGDVSLGLGLAETLTGSLGSTKNLFVLSVNAGRDAARIGGTPHHTGKEFKAKYLLRGNFEQRAGGEIQITAEFIETESEKFLWSRKFVSAGGGDLSGLQVQIVEAVRESLGLEISDSDEQKIFKRQTANSLAYEFYLAGRHQMVSRSHQGLHRAITAFSQAIEKDSQFALAYVGLADAYALENLYENPPPPDAYEKAKSSVLRALELDENLAEAHATLGYILFYSERDRQGAERAFRRAIELNPSYATSHHWFGLTLAAMGRNEEALTQMALARKLDPRSAIISSAKGIIHFYARQSREGIEECEKALAIDSGFVPALKTMRWIYQVERNYGGAMNAFHQEKNFSGSTDSPGWLTIEAQVEALGDERRRRYARDVIEKAVTDDYVKSNPRSYSYEIALAYAALDEREQALEWLEKAEASQNHSINFLEVDPRLEKIRSGERYLNLLKKVKKN